MKISIIIPCYNNQDSLAPLMQRMQQVELHNIFKTVDFEYVFVDDGSKDKTYQVQLLLKEQYPQKVKVIKLTRNFGSYNSFLAKDIDFNV